MSYVTGVILCHSVGEGSYEDEAQNILYPIHEALNRFFGDPGAGLVWVDDPKLPKGWYGGDKYLQMEVLIGSFNYLDERFLAHVAALPWQEPKRVLVILDTEEGDYPEVHWPCRAKDDP